MPRSQYQSPTYQTIRHAGELLATTKHLLNQTEAYMIHVAAEGERIKTNILAEQDQVHKKLKHIVFEEFCRKVRKQKLFKRHQVNATHNLEEELKAATEELEATKMKNIALEARNSRLERVVYARSSLQYETPLLMEMQKSRICSNQ